MEERESFKQNPVLWWEPGVTYGSPEELAWAAEKTIAKGPTFAAWKVSR
jgi:glutathione S-transferase